MTGEVTRGELRLIQKELREIRVVLETVLSVIAGREWAREYLTSGEVKNEANFRRFISDTGLYNLGVPRRGRGALRELDVVTLEEAVAIPRDEFARLPGGWPQDHRANRRR